MFQIPRSAVAAALLLSVLMGLPGCSSKVTADNYAKVQQGQTEDQVDGVLGKATTVESQTTPIGSGSKKTWKDGDKTIMVGFIDGKVVMVDKSGF